MGKERESGFYWVKYKGEWIVAYWWDYNGGANAPGNWFITRDHDVEFDCMDDDDFEELDELRLTKY